MNCKCLSPVLGLDQGGNGGNAGGKIEPGAYTECQKAQTDGPEPRAETDADHGNRNDNGRGYDRSPVGHLRSDKTGTEYSDKISDRNK